MWKCGYVSQGPKALIVEGSGTSKIDGSYRRSAAIQKSAVAGHVITRWANEQCIYIGIRHTQELRIGPFFGTRKCKARVRDFQTSGTEQPCLPCDPYPSSWNVVDKGAGSKE